MTKTVHGTACEIKLTKQGKGYAYEVSKAGVNGYVICSGWSAGTRKEAIEEAERYAAIRMGHRPY